MTSNEKKTQVKSEHLPGERVVAFLDILGFREHVQEMGANPDLFEVIKDMLYQVKEVHKTLTVGVPNEPTHAELAQFSDSIVLSYPIGQTPSGDVSAMAEMVIRELTGSLAARLLQSGILVRGGIAIGWTHHEGNVCLGEGVIRAFDLENRCADVPRIVIVDELAQTWDNALQLQIIKQDSDGLYFLNVLRYIRPDHRFGLPSTTCMGYLHRTIIDGLNTYSDKLNILKKYRWLAGQYNAEIKFFSNKPGFDQLESITIT